RGQAVAQAWTWAWSASRELLRVDTAEAARQTAVTAECAAANDGLPSVQATEVLRAARAAEKKLQAGLPPLHLGPLALPPAPPPLPRRPAPTPPPPASPPRSTPTVPSTACPSSRTPAATPAARTRTSWGTAGGAGSMPGGVLSWTCCSGRSRP